MATINSMFPSLLDATRRLDPNGRIATLAELLTQTNSILEDAVAVEGNLPTGHRVTIRTGLPTVYFRMLNQGVPPSKSTTAQVDETTAILEAYSEIDEDLAMLNGNTAEFRLSEDLAFIEAMNQKQAETMFYGNLAADPKSYAGLAIRYSAKSGAVNGQNVILGGGSGSVNTSVWLIGWGQNTVFTTYPKGSVGGLIHDDLGRDTTIDAQGGRLQVLRSRYQWKCGLVVKDWRYVVRIANVDTSNLVSGTNAADLLALMNNAIDRLPSLGNVRPVFYVNRTVASALRRQSQAKNVNVLAYEQGLNSLGQNIYTLRFLGIPVRIVDALLSTEATIS